MADRYLNETPSPAASEEGSSFRFLKNLFFAILLFFICLTIIAIGYFYGWSEWKKSMYEQKEYYSLLQTNEKLQNENKKLELENNKLKLENNKLKLEIEEEKDKSEALIRQEQIKSKDLLQKERLDWEREKAHMRNYGPVYSCPKRHYVSPRRGPRTPRRVKVRYKKD